MLDATSFSSPLPFEPLLDCRDAARLLHVHPKTLSSWARAGRVPGQQIGRKWFFRASELDGWWRELELQLPSVRVN